MKGTFREEDVKPFMNVAVSLYDSPNARAVVRIMALRGGILRRQKLVSFIQVAEELMDRRDIIAELLVSGITEKLNRRKGYNKTMYLY